MELPTVDEARARDAGGDRRRWRAETSRSPGNGRVLREEVTAARDQPPFDASAMDGWAVRSGRRPATLRIVGESAAGHGWSGTLGRGEAVRILTGAAIPAGADRVVIQEEAKREGDRVRVGPAGAAGFIRPRGGDFARGDGC